MSKSSSASKQIGTLVVVVLKARNLNNASFYKQSPYTLVRFGGGGQCTKEDYKGGQHPVWDEEIRFPVFRSTQEQLKKGERLALKVGVFTKGTKRTDERLGEGEVKIDEVLRTGEFDGWIPLSVDGNQRGEIYLELTYFPMAQSLTRRPSKLSPTERIWRPLPSPNLQELSLAEPPSSGLASMPSVLRPGNQRYAGGQSPSRDPENSLSSGVGSPYSVSQEDVRVAELREQEEFFARRRQEEEDAEFARQLFEEEEERNPISGQNAMIIPGGWVE